MKKYIKYFLTKVKSIFKKIKMGGNVDIGARNRICGDVIIGSNVLFGPNNYITSNTHNYENVDVAIIFQGASNINKNNRGYLEIKYDS